MPTYVALLRAVNLGSTRKIAMSDLRKIVEEAGGEDVTTFIQSGNVVFRHTARSVTKLEADVEDRIQSATGIDVPVMIRTAKQMASVVEGNPFGEADPRELHVSFLKAKPAAQAVDAIDAAAFAPDEFVVAGRDVYIHLPNGMARAKLPQALTKLGTPGTVRTWKTVTKLLELASG